VDRRRVLFVDDDPSILRGFERLFWKQQAKWETAFARGPEAALAHLAAGRFDVVVCDLHMPGMNGDELLRRIGRESPATRRILLSGSIAMVDVTGFADCLLMKPCATAMLIDAIEGQTCAMR
jgi:CheY-like chemotaxis protein